MLKNRFEIRGIVGYRQSVSDKSLHNGVAYFLKEHSYWSRHHFFHEFVPQLLLNYIPVYIFYMNIEKFVKTQVHESKKSHLHISISNRCVLVTYLIIWLVINLHLPQFQDSLFLLLQNQDQFGPNMSISADFSLRIKITFTQLHDSSLRASIHH